MYRYTIKRMEGEAETDGKGYVHNRSWHENIPVAKDGDRVIGFVGFGAYRDNTLPGYGEIFAIYVLKEYHGKRVGYELMNAALERLSDYEKIAVWVLRGNDRAIRFYERYGFRFDGAESEIVLGSPNTELRMIYDRDAQI